MAKSAFSDEVLDIWRTIRGNKGLGLSPAQRHNVVDIIRRKLRLGPLVVRLGDEHGEFDPDTFRGLPIRSHPDNWCSVYYHPHDCEVVTGSRAHNWTQWASKLLGYGHNTHKFAPKLRPPKDVLERLEEKGLVGRKKVIRLLSVEVVAFYLCAQQRTWKHPDRIAATRDLFRAQGLKALPIAGSPPPEAEDVDVDEILAGDDVPQTVVPPLPAEHVSVSVSIPDPKTNLPKAANDLLAYKPGQVRVGDGMPAAGVIADGHTGSVPLLDEDARDPVMEVLDELRVPQGVRTDEAMSDDAIKARIEELQAVLEERQRKRWERRFRAEAERGEVVGGDVRPDRGEWAKLRMRFPNGREVSYYHVESVVAFLRGTRTPSDDDVHELKAAAEELHDLYKRLSKTG